MYSFLFKFIKNQRWIFLSIFILDILAWPLDSVLWPFILRYVIDIFTKYDMARSGAWPFLKLAILFGISLALFVETTSRIMGFLMGKAIPKLQQQIRIHMFDHIQHHSPKYFNDKFAGNLSNKINDFATHADILINQLYWPIVPSISACFMSATLLWFVKPLFSYIVIGWFIFHISLCILFTRSICTKEHKHSNHRSDLMGRIVDSLTNNFSVNLFYRFGFEKHKIQYYQNKEEKSNRAVKYSIEAMRCVLSVVFLACIVFAALGSLVYLWLNHYVTTGEVIQVFTTLWSFGMIVWALGSSLPIFFQSLGVLKQAHEVMLDPQNLGDLDQPSDLKITHGEISFENISFSYDETKLFNNFNLHIKAGEKVGIVGYTGAGKSTLINLLLRFMQTSNGQIQIDGQNIDQVSLASLRRQIALIPQNPILFHRSLLENIHYGKPEATEDEILSASKAAHCHEFIQKMPQQYESRVGERGTKLSGGEKQRIAIARSLLVDAPILILDEATSALDSMTEGYVHDSLSKMMKNKTTLAIAHRLSTLLQMDRIIVLDNGKIIEEGTFDQLNKLNGLFSKMWKRQIGGFLPESIN